MDDVKYISSNAMCYTILYMLEWMRKGKHKIGTMRTQELRNLALSAYIHGEILYGLHIYFVRVYYNNLCYNEP